jgi:hypothetical protein
MILRVTGSTRGCDFVPVACPWARLATRAHGRDLLPVPVPIGVGYPQISMPAGRIAIPTQGVCPIAKKLS